ncbi:MAG: hypothetical protein N2246_04035 [Candidatus Sumerlaeia bacterium]|nr:hypothetical protein [Candidatus Sumerlaeia bacterium]
MISKTNFTRSHGGFTFTEILMVAFILSIVLGFMAYIISYSARSQAVLLSQLQNQQSAARALQIISDLLRNATEITSTVPLVNSNTIEYRSKEHPAGQISRIAKVGKNILYYPDITQPNNFRVLARGVESLEFTFPSDEFDINLQPTGNNIYMIIVKAVFKYRKFRGYNQSEAERLNGTFETRIFPRNMPQT